MAFDDLENKECVCDFINNIGAVKDTFNGFLDSIIAILTAANAAIALWPADVGDQLKRLALEAEIAAIEYK